MSIFDIAIYTIKFIIPSIFCILFRAFGLGYTTNAKLALGLTVFSLYIIIVPAMLIAILGYGQYTHIASLVMTVGIMSALIFSSDPPIKTVLLTLIIGQMNAVVSVPLNMIRHVLNLSYLTLDILLLIICPIIYLIALRFWIKPLRFISDNLQEKLTAPMLIPIITTAIIYAIPVYPSRNFEFHPIHCTILMLAVEAIFFLYIYTLYHSLLKITLLSEQKLETELLRLSVTSMAERISLMNEATHQQSLAAHDRRHFNSMILELLEQGNQGDALAFLQRHTEAKPSMYKRCCDNAAINAIVSYYATLSRKKGIVTDINLDIPNNLAIDSIELAMALSNLFENAIHGCDALPKTAKKEIHIASRYVGRLALQISNTCATNISLDKNGYPIAFEKGHGIGTKSVIAFAKKYNAELFYRIDNGIFIVRLLV